MATSNFIKIAIKPGSTVTESAEKSLANYGAWETVSQEWAANPDTSAAWTWEEIAALQIGVALKKLSGSGGVTGNCTQVYVEVEYTAAAGPALLKTVNGLVKASVKTVNGLVIASVKTWNGLA